MRHGAVDNSDVGVLHAVFAALPVPQKIIVSNVAGTALAQQLNALLPHVPHIVQAQAQQCGVRNAYVQVTQLGSDRWAALIAAWQMQGEACLVVNCGTATTVDALSAQGEFLGGLILPSVDLMQSSLVRNTAQLDASVGALQDFPCNTADAIYSGAVQATLGAIRQQAALLRTQKILLSGGAAGNIHAHLGVSCKLVDNLVLRGLAIIGQEMTA